MPAPSSSSDHSARLHADMDPLRAQLGLRPRRAPLTPRPDAGPLDPPPPLGPGSASTIAPAGATPRATPPTRPRPHDSGASRALRDVGDATTAGVRALPQSPVAAAFGVAERLTSAGRAATGGASHLRRSLRPAHLAPAATTGPALFVVHAPRGARR